MKTLSIPTKNNYFVVDRGRGPGLGVAGGEAGTCERGKATGGEGNRIKQSYAGRLLLLLIG